jgi:hypothetical protein
LAGVVVERAELAGTLLCIRVCTRLGAAACPACGRSSRRVHSHYQRRLADTAIGGRRVMPFARMLTQLSRDVSLVTVGGIGLSFPGVILMPAIMQILRD